MRYKSSLAVVCLALGIMGCQTSVQNTRAVSASAPPAVTTHLVNEYRIGVDDHLKVAVWRNPELSVEIPVRPDGYISVPLAGEVPAGGLAPAQVARIIEERLKRYIKAPKVSVILTEVVSHQFLSRVRVTGAIEAPLSLSYRQGMTVLDLILEAGGVTDFAQLNKARLYRKNEQGQNVAYPVRLDRILQAGDLSTNYSLQPGDVITVPERGF